jgi:hypothetical protein
MRLTPAADRERPALASVGPATVIYSPRMRIAAILAALAITSCASTERGRGTQLAAVGGGLTVVGTGAVVATLGYAAILQANDVQGDAALAAPLLIGVSIVGVAELAIGAGLLWYGGALIDGTEERAPSPSPSPSPSPEPSPAAPKSNPDATPW